MAAKPDVVVEVVGTLASLCLPGFDWQSYLSRHGLEFWLGARLVAGNVDDDIVLECIMLSGTVCDEGSAPLLADAGLVRIASHACLVSTVRSLAVSDPSAMLQVQHLVALLEDRRQDAEFVLQIVATLQTFMRFTPTRAAVLSGTKVTALSRR